MSTSTAPSPSSSPSPSPSSSPSSSPARSTAPSSAGGLLSEAHRAARAAADHLGLQPPWQPEDDVQLVAWPEGQALREQLARSCRPRLLIVAPGAEPPEDWDDLEDWLRTPIDPEEAAYRQHALRQRLHARGRGLLIDDGLLRRGDAWLSLTPTQLALTRPLVGNAGRVVRRHDLEQVFADAGGTPSATAFASCIKRLRAKLAEVGAVLHVLSEGRYLLEVDPDHGA